MTKRTPIYNRTEQKLQLGLEPEGDVFVLEPGEQCVLRFEPVDGIEIEIEIEVDLISIHYSGSKELWKDGERVWPNANS